MVSTGEILDVVNLFTDLGLTAYIGLGVIFGAVGYLFARTAKAGR